MDGNKMVKTVLVSGAEAKSHSILSSELDNAKWEKCIVPTMLGVPLMVRVLNIPATKPNKELGIFLMVDPVSGLAPLEWQIQVGTVEFACCDKTDFDVQTFWNLYSYIFHLMDYYGDDDFNYNKFSRTHLVPKSYQKYCEENLVQRNQA